MGAGGGAGTHPYQRKLFFCMHYFIQQGLLPHMLSEEEALLEQPHVTGVIVNARSQGFLAGLAGT